MYIFAHIGQACCFCFFFIIFVVIFNGGEVDDDDDDDDDDDASIISPLMGEQVDNDGIEAQKVAFRNRIKANTPPNAN
jgi:hypothetical protein